MRRILLLLGLLTLGCVTPARAETWKGEAAVAFAGTSTLHDWEGKVAAKPFSASLTLVEGRVDRLVATVEVAVAEMDTDNEGRDENLRKAMRAPEHPLVRGSVAASIPPGVVQGKPGKVPIELTLLGKALKVEAEVSEWRSEEGKVTFECGFPLSLEACGIEIPSFLFFIRVGDTVNVRVRLTLARA